MKHPASPTPHHILVKDSHAMQPHPHFNPVMYYLSQAFDYIRQYDDTDDSMSLTEHAIYEQLPSAPLPDTGDTPGTEGATTGPPLA